MSIIIKRAIIGLDEVKAVYTSEMEGLTENKYGLLIIAYKDGSREFYEMDTYEQVEKESNYIQKSMNLKIKTYMLQGEFELLLGDE